MKTPIAEFEQGWIHIHMYGWIPLLFTWICHNIVTWLYHKFKKLKKIILTKKKTKNYHCSTSSSVFSVVSVPDFSLPNRCVVISHFVAFCLVGCSRCGMWDLVPWPRMNLGPMCWEHGVLATGPPGKSPHCCFNLHFPDNIWCGTSFHILICHLYMFFGNACEGQGGLVCCGSWGRKESDMTGWLNWTELNESLKIFGPSFNQAFPFLIAEF